MIVIRARNVQAALPAGVRLLRDRGTCRESRNGPVVVAPEPVTIVYERPEERVLFWPDRDANPFLHTADALWCLAGRNDVDFLAFFATQMREYSDDGRSLAGAYGYRWRKKFGVDQLGEVIAGLRRNPECRRQVVQMYSAEEDLGSASKDVCCNVAASFQVDPSGQLDMVVFQRSGDLCWGSLGANPVQFGFLHEYIAGGVGVPLGRHWNTVANLHAYPDTFNPLLGMADWNSDFSQYPAPPYPLGVSDEGTEDFDDECIAFCCWEPIDAFRLPFFREVAVPMRDAYAAYKATPKPEAFDSARSILEAMSRCDWRLAAEEWIDRRENRWQDRQ